MIRKILAVTMMIVVSAAMTACGTSKSITASDPASIKESPIKADSPEDFIEKLIRAYYIDKTEEVDTMWDKVVSEKSKELNCMTENEYTSIIKQNLFQYDFIDVLVNSSDKVQENIYKVIFNVKYGSNGQEGIDTCTWYVIEENDNYKILLYGAIEYNEFLFDETDGSEFTLDNLKAYKAVDGVAFTYDFVNNSGRTIKLGPWASAFQVTLITDDGSEYTCSLDSMIMIYPNNSCRESMKFEGAMGNPVKLVFNQITYVESNGLPSLPPEETTYTVTLN